MRWLDIDLTGPGLPAGAEGLLAAVAARRREVPALQEQAGADSPAVVRLMAELGRLLFQAVTAAQPQAFSTAREGSGAVDPWTGVTETDHVVGYHLVVHPAHLDLPWIWLHNGLEFLLERAPLAVSLHGSRLSVARLERAWMARHRDTLFTQHALGARPLAAWLDALRPRECADPEILFLAGHCDEDVRPLLFREADAIRRALDAAPLARPLARLAVPDGAVTPGLLRRRGPTFQGYHFAGPTVRPPLAPAEMAWERLESLGLGPANDGAPDAEAPHADAADALGAGPWPDAVDAASPLPPLDLVGELELVGVDPVTALLDELEERAERRRAGADAASASRATAAPGAAAGAATGAAAQRAQGAGAAAGPAASGAGGSSVATAGAPWLLEDGPVQPEELARDGGLPPLVFSNSYLSLPELGSRFLGAGASTFVGPVAAVMSRPAREFAARFYACLADGYCAAAALRAAALACRERYGEEHPVWLSYGLLGYGSLALQYL